MISVRPAIVTINYFDTKFYTAFDAFAEEPIDQSYDGHELVVDLSEDVYTDEKPNELGKQTLFADYMFAMEGDRVKFTMDVEDNGGIELPQVVFSTDIPVNRNHLTTVYGPILTDANNITVTIDENFAGNINVNVWDGMTVAEPKNDAEGNYVIYEGSELAWIADQVNGVTRAGEAKTFIGETIVLANDIDLGGNRWTPIGNSSNHSSTFRGTFDGNGKKITNLSVSGGTGVGLFGLVSPKAIKNLTIENAVIYGTHYAGALAGWVQAVDSQAHNRGAITDCHVKNAKVVLSVEDKDNGDKAAGLVGYAVRIDVNDCTVENAEVAAYRDVAGLLGLAHKGCVVSNNVVKDVTVTADQTVEYGEVEDSNAGEVVGRIMEGAVVENNTTENVTVIRKVDSTEELAYAVADAKSGDTIYIGGEVALPKFTDKSLTFEGVNSNAAIVEPVTSHTEKAFEGSSLYFKKLKIKGTVYSSTSNGYMCADVESYTACTFVDGYFMFAGENTTVNNCVFNGVEGQYYWTGHAKNIVFDECTFNGVDRAVKVCSKIPGEYSATFNKCTFSATVQNKAALEIDGELSNGADIINTVNINNCVASGFKAGENTGEPLFNIKNGPENVTINIDGSKWVTSSSDLINTLAKGENATLSCDVNVGTTQLALAEGQEINLNGHTLTTQMSSGGISMKKGASIKGGTIEHTSTVAAIKAFNVGSIEDVTIKCTCTTPGKTITGIAIQNGGYVESIKNVTIEGATQCIEVGYQATVDTIENVRVNGTNIGLIINGGKVKKAVGCTFKGANYGVYMHLKGVFAVGLELEDCDVEGTKASIYAFDEKGISNTSGSLTLTYDAATTLVGPFIWDFEDECKSVVTLNQPE
jgi:hypothetical protein